MKVAPQHIIHKAILWLVIHTPRLILEDNIIVPASLDCEILWLAIEERVSRGHCPVVLFLIFFLLLGFLACFFGGSLGFDFSEFGVQGRCIILIF